MSAATQSQPAICDLTLRIAGMSCAACQAHVQRALAAVPGVSEASVDLLGHTAHVTADPAVSRERLTAAVRNAGYDVGPDQATGASNEAGAAGRTPTSEPEQTSLGLRALLSLLAGALAMLLSMPLMGTNSGAGAWTRNPMELLLPLLPGPIRDASPDLLRWTLFGIALLTMLFAAPEIYRAAFRAARHRATNMNTLVALGTLIAFGASAYTTVSASIGRPSQNFSDVYFEAVVLILAFLLSGRWLEARARQRATDSLRAFAHVETGNVRWVAEGMAPPSDAALEALLGAPETLLPLDAAAVGDLVKVLPGDRVPLDGIVLAGRSAVDESMMTGEPLPVTRAAGDKLFSGTLNLDGPLLLRATALGADSMQAQMARLLERARASRAPLQGLADRVSAVFVPTVLVLAALTFTVWAVAGNTGGQHQGYGRALSFAVAVLVVACPCAMGLAVPAAVAVSLGSAARAGVLIKGGEALERLAAVDRAVFDKTGTLTEGKPRIVGFHVRAELAFAEKQVLAWAAALEAISTHPLAAAVRQFAADRGAAGVDLVPVDARVLPGLGVSGTIGGHQLLIGSSALLSQDPEYLPDTTASAPDHATALHLLIDGRAAAHFFATDTLRPTAAPAIAQLRQLGMQPVLLTGDRPEAAAEIATAAGIATVLAGRLPADKLTDIEAMQRGGHHVAMVGDGLNDAAALARADAGIAVASGTDLAREAGHVLLLQHDLRLVPLSIQIARQTRRLMRQNLGWALGYNLVGLPLAAGVFLPRFGIALSPAFASAAMALSSVSVLLNSLRLAKTPGVAQVRASVAPPAALQAAASR